jgi:alkylhydroperoxidase/carboxymuconolactone decarboxylase family protein YurZ
MAKLPRHFRQFTTSYPAVARAYEELGARCHASGPLDERSRALVKLGLAIGTRQEGSVHAQVRKAIDAGLTPEELRQAAILAIPTVGFPAAMAALSWIDDLLGRPQPQKRARR